MRRLLCHLPAICVVGLAIWSRVYPLLDSITGWSDRGFFATLFSTIWSTLSPSFLIGIAFSIVLAYLFSAVFVWIREIQILEGEIADAERLVSEEVRKHGNQVISTIDGRVQSLHDEFEQLSKVIQ
jgi:MFS superfamily sulfate permease-like transporter